MRTCLGEEELERLVRGRAPWWRALFWRRHVQRCAACRSRLEALREDERLLEEVRRAVAAPPEPSPLSCSRASQRPQEGGRPRGADAG